MYAKVFAQIFDSSIADDYELRHFFMDLLVLCESDGVVDMTQEAIAARTRMPVNSVREMLLKLEAPDPRSRTHTKEGSRLIRIDPHRDWGWKIVNYENYRDIRDEDERKNYMRDYMRDYRSKRKLTVNSVSSSKPKQRQRQKHTTEAEREAPEPRTHLPEVEVPSWGEVQAECQKIGLAEWRARDWFDEMESFGWKDGKNREVMQWRAFLTRVRTWWERDGRPAEPPSKTNGASNSTADAIRNQTALERVEDRLKVIRGQFPLSDFHPLKEEFKELKAERDRLKKLLGFKA